MLNYDNIKTCVRLESERLGLCDWELYYSEASDISAETFRDEISSFVSSVGLNIYYRCVIDGKTGSASTQSDDEAEVTALVSRAAENARISEKEERAIIYGGSKPEDYRKTELPEFTLPDGAKIKEVVLDSQKVLYSSDERIADGTESDAYASRYTIRLYNSKGLDLSCDVGSSTALLYAVLDDGNEKVFAYDAVYNSLDSFDNAAKTELAKKVVEDAAAKFGAGKVKTGKYNVVFSTKQASNLLSAFVSVFFAEQAQKGLSLLAGKVGEQIAAECVNITDDPFYPTNPIQRSFDGEGFPTRTKRVVENGKLLTLLYNLTSAEKDGVESTGNSSRGGTGTVTYTFYIEPGKTSRDELFKAAGEGIYITEMKGLHAGANAVTGDFSIESAGFMIRDGKLAEPVKSFTIAGNFFELLKNIDTLGSEIDLRAPGFSRVAAPDLLVRDLPAAGE